MKKLLTTLFISLSLVSGAAYAEADKQSPLTEPQAIQLLKEDKPLYSCEMHEHIYADKEGKCPICKMNLTRASTIENGKAVFKESKGTMDMKMMEKK